MLGKVIIGATLTLIATASAVTARGPEATGRMAIVPVTIIESFTQRPTITVRFNGHPFRMMLHSQAGFPGGADIQLRHDRAAEFGVTLVGKGIKYGIDRLGHGSDVGSDMGRISTVRVGDFVEHDVPVSVFEVPQRDLGMLGTKWLTRHRVMIDFQNRQAIIAPTPAYAAATRRRLLANGYKVVAMTLKDGGFSVKGAVNGVSRDLAVGTASETALDTAFATAAGVEHRPSGEAFGPTGTVVYKGTAIKPTRLAIGDWISPAITTLAVVDRYGYSAQARPANAAQAIGGDLGCNILLQAGAIVDFGRGELYLK